MHLGPFICQIDIFTFKEREVSSLGGVKSHKGIQKKRKLMR